MKKLVLLLGAFTIAIIISCKDEHETIVTPGDMIFGHFYGECIGEACIEIFKLETDSLMEDTLDTYPSAHDFYQGSYILLSDDKHTIAKKLLNYFPLDLLDEKDTVIGSPDAADGGGLYIEYNFGNIRKFWLLDQMKSNVPEKYHEFIDKVNETIVMIQ